MNRTSIPSIQIPIVVLVMISCSCTPFSVIRDNEPLQNRVEDTLLIIGCVIVEPFECNKYGPYIVALGYQPPGPKLEYLKKIWFKTDSSGYFHLANMPAGHYKIAGVRIWSPDLPLIGPTAHGVRIREQGFDLLLWDYGEDFPYEDPWWIMDPNEGPGGEPYGYALPRAYTPKSWPEILEGNILNLGYLVLTYREDWVNAIHFIVHSYDFELLNGERFILDKEYFRPTVPEYLLTKYPDSEWATYLEKII